MLRHSIHQTFSGFIVDAISYHVDYLCKSEPQKLLKEQGTTIDVIKSPTQEDAGSPNINEAIWKQIQGVDIFIADLSFVSRVRTSNDKCNV